MSILKLTENLENFIWTNHEGAGLNHSQISGRHGGTVGPTPAQPPHQEEHSKFDNGVGFGKYPIDTPQTYTVGNIIITGHKTFPRPNVDAIALMTDRVGWPYTPFDNGVQTGPVDFFSGVKGSWGTGTLPLGFSFDMTDSFLAPGTPPVLSLNTLRHTIYSVGVSPEFTINTQRYDELLGSQFNTVGGIISSQYTNTDQIHQSYGTQFHISGFNRGDMYISNITEPSIPTFKSFSRGSAILSRYQFDSPNFPEPFDFPDTIPYNIPQITATGPQSDSRPFDETPHHAGAHGSDFLTVPLASYSGLYIGAQGDIVPITPSVIGLGVNTGVAGTFDYTELRGRLYDHYQDHYQQSTTNFVNIPYGDNLFGEDEAWKGGSIHIGSQDTPLAIGVDNIPVYDFMTTPVDVENLSSLYSPPASDNLSATFGLAPVGLTTPDFTTWGTPDITIPISYDKTRNVFNHYTIPAFADSIHYQAASEDGTILADVAGTVHPNSIFHQLGLISGTQADTTSGDKNYKVYSQIDNVTFSNLLLETDPFNGGWKGGSIHIPSDVTEASAIGGGALQFANLDVSDPLGTPHQSIYQNADGEYTIPSDFESILLETGGESQRTFNIPADYPNNLYAYNIDTQFGNSWGAKYIPSDSFTGGSGETTYYLNDNFESTTLAARFLSYNFNNPDWPYKGVGLNNFRLLPISPAMKTPDHAEGNNSAAMMMIGQGLMLTGNPVGLAAGGALAMGAALGLGNWSWTEELPDTHQPYIRKDIGQRYGDSNPSSNTPHPRAVGTPLDYGSLLEQRTLDDVTRIENWLKSPIGKKWAGNQAYLQGLNPRPETRTWDKSSIINSIAPFLHADRHSHGLLSDGESYEKYKPLIDGDMAKYGFGIRYGEGADYGQIKLGATEDDYKSRLTRLTNEFIIPEVVASVGTGFLGGIASSIAGAIGGLLSGTATGMPPVTPSHDVKSQGGPFGESNIWVKANGPGQYTTTPYSLLGHNEYFTPAKPTDTTSAPPKKEGEDPSISEAFKSKMKKMVTVASDGISKLEGAMVKRNLVKFVREKEDKQTWEDLKKSFDTRVAQLNKIHNTLGDAGNTGNLVPINDTKTGLGYIKVLNGEQDPKYKTAATDNINMIPYGKDYSDDDSDFIKFKFKDIVNDKFIVFRAILSGISDSISPEWESTRYIGRPDDVHVYTGTSRSISFTFNIYPNTKQEFPVLLEKLNYLVGLCYPSYTAENRMVAPFIQLTLGDMFVDTPGFLSSLSVDVDDNSTWEIDNGLQFPKYITCGCEFTYVGKYLPSTLGKHYELGWLSDQGWSADSAGTFRKTDGKLDARPDRLESNTTLNTKLKNINTLFDKIDPKPSTGAQ